MKILNQTALPTWSEEHSFWVVDKPCPNKWSRIPCTPLEYRFYLLFLRNHLVLNENNAIGSFLDNISFVFLHRLTKNWGQSLVVLRNTSWTRALSLDRKVIYLGSRAFFMYHMTKGYKSHGLICFETGGLMEVVFLMFIGTI